MKLAGILTLVTLTAVSAFAGRPLTIDDADPVDPRQFEFELGETYVKQPDCKHWDYPLGLTYGVIPDMEIGISFGGQYETRSEFLAETETDHICEESGIGDLAIGVKYRFLTNHTWMPRQALSASVKLPTADSEEGLGSGETDYNLTWIASKSLTDEMSAHINAGYSWIGEPDGENVGNILLYGIAADYQLNETVQIVGEIFAEKELGGGSGTASQFNAGLRWSPVDHLTLDVAGGPKISGDAPDYTVTAGLTISFGVKQQ